MVEPPAASASFFGARVGGRAGAEIAGSAGDHGSEEGTSDFYGPVVVNEIIREALHPYPADLHIVTKVGARRGDHGSWKVSLEPDDLKAQVRENLQHLALDVVNLRLSSVEGTSDESIADQFGALAELQQKDLIRHLGLSGVSSVQLTEAQTIAPVVTV